ncbi:hypothetical protein [Wolbachia endosymbiont (group B) of Xanthorhoe designata]|uniref:hypothetical protein n=1 Tax=Wolbachia endosymbiont (group B) of Xanthorhoe designata TaxID=3066184 RepID=UPI0033406682
MLLTERQKTIRDSLISEAIKGNFESIKNNYDSDVQKVLESKLPSDVQEKFKEDLPNPCTTLKFITFQKNQKEINQYKQKIESTSSGIVMKEAKGSNDPNVKKIQDLLYYAVQQNNLKKVQNILNSNPNSDVQKALKSKFSYNYTILDFAIFTQKKEGDIIKALWQKADQETRILLSNSAIKLANKSSDYDVKNLFQKLRITIESTPKKPLEQTYEESNQKNGICGRAIQKVENLKRISDLHYKLRQAIDYLDVKKVKAVLEDCDTNLAMILNRPIHSQSKTTLLLYPLQVGLNKRYIGDGERLKQEDLRNIKEITKLLWDKASPDIRDFWFKFHQDQQEESTKDTKATFEAHLKNASPDIRNLWLKYQRVPENQDAAVIKLLKGEQQRHAKIDSEKWLEDFIQEVKDYTEQKSIEENLEIATEKPTTKSVLQDAQLSQINRTCCIL